MLVKDLDSDAKMVNFMLFNTSGLLVKQGTLSNNSINVSELSGIFLLKILNGNQLIGIQKVVLI